MRKRWGEVVRVLGTLMWIILLSILFGMLKYLIKTKKNGVNTVTATGYNTLPVSGQRWEGNYEKQW